MRIPFLKPLLAMAIALTALAPTTLLNAQVGGPSTSRAVVTKDSAYLLLPPELIAAPIIKTLQPSPNERLLLIERENIRLTPATLRAAMVEKRPPTGERSLVLWDSVARASRDVWKDTTGTITIQRMAWLPQSETALILVNQILPPDPKDPMKGPQIRHGILRVTATMEKAQVVGLTELGETYAGLELHVSPSQPFAVLQETSYKEQKIPQPDGSTKNSFDVQTDLYVMNETGRLGTRATIPNGIYIMQVQWSPEGSPLVQVMPKPTPGQKPEMKWYAMNPKTAELRPIDKQPDMSPANTLKAANRIAANGNIPLRVRMTKQPVKEGDTTQSVGLLWLESTERPESSEGSEKGAPMNGSKPISGDKQRTLISSDSFGGEIAARGEVILYQSQGALWAAPLLKLTRAEYDEAIVAAERAALLSNAKQLGLAALMYSQDYDETLPDGNDINSKLEPYLKNNSLFAGFTYTFAGGKLSSVEKPAETELGFVDGPGGRAIIYIDGHVKWRSDK